MCKCKIALPRIPSRNVLLVKIKKVIFHRIVSKETYACYREKLPCPQFIHAILRDIGNCNFDESHLSYFLLFTTKNEQYPAFEWLMQNKRVYVICIYKGILYMGLPTGTPIRHACPLFKQVIPTTMYLFVPRQFVMENFKIKARVNLYPGISFKSGDGLWTSYQNQRKDKECPENAVNRIHWFQILHMSKWRAPRECLNAIVHQENRVILLRIIKDVIVGNSIAAEFHSNLSLRDISFETLFLDNMVPDEPLDLSQKSKNQVTRNMNKKKHMLPCSICNKPFDRPSLLKRHIRTHTGERPHSCDICGKGFSTSSSLNTHRRIHSGERPHQCKICGKRFTASSNLYYHRLTHSAEKPHKCDICQKSFPTPGNLRSHTYLHLNSSPFKCNVCSRSFAKLNNLKNHQHFQHNS